MGVHRRGPKRFHQRDEGGKTPGVVADAGAQQPSVPLGDREVGVHGEDGVQVSGQHEGRPISRAPAGHHVAHSVAFDPVAPAFDSMVARRSARRSSWKPGAGVWARST